MNTLMWHWCIPVYIIVSACSIAMSTLGPGGSGVAPEMVSGAGAEQVIGGAEGFDLMLGEAGEGSLFLSWGSWCLQQTFIQMTVIKARMEATRAPPMTQPAIITMVAPPFCGFADDSDGASMEPSGSHAPCESGGAASTII